MEKHEESSLISARKIVYFSLTMFDHQVEVNHKQYMVIIVQEESNIFFPHQINEKFKGYFWFLTYSPTLMYLASFHQLKEHFTTLMVRLICSPQCKKVTITQ